jgi:gamma-glutamylcyclotransferase (GGCT)/AIG2-like uncharacterized protein YtfP
MPEYIFSYGTLQNDKVQIQLFGRKLAGKKDVLTGFRISPIVITDSKFLANNPEKNQLIVFPTGSHEDRIEGNCLELTEKELKSADQYEPEDYKRIKVILESGTEAWIYAGIQ